MLRYLIMTLLLALTIPAVRADDDTNRGQAVSDCNHSANARELKGQDRQDFVDWCVARRSPFDKDQVNRYPDCNAFATERGLRDEARRDFVDRCVDYDDRSKHD